MAEEKNRGKPQDALRDAAEQAARAFRDATDPERVAQAQAAMGLDPARMQETLRMMAERAQEQSRDAYDRVKAAAEEAGKAMETTVESAHGGSLTLSRKAIEAMRTNAEMGFTHLEKLAAVKSLSELIELQTSYVRRQIETAAEQAREMQALSRSVAQDMLRPAREAADKMRERD
ncbi:phasin family protein [Aureimonas populi]|uniref:Phasin family protein n=1 Tax=Aureimonas populi TaxID=1701758 RepID=A0ABW5CHY0_9HYPH|nr:phasin family protein [Aureimonas populi]